MVINPCSPMLGTSDADVIRGKHPRSRPNAPHLRVVGGGFLHERDALRDVVAFLAPVAVDRDRWRLAAFDLAAEVVRLVEVHHAPA